MSELKVYKILGIEFDSQFYHKAEADKVIESIIKGAMSMFRESNRCRGLDTKSPLGRIAHVAFKHWMYVERMEARITEKDKVIAELKMKLAGAKRNCKNCLQCHEIEDKGNFYKVFCKQVGHWIMWNKEDNCTEFLPKEVK